MPQTHTYTHIHTHTPALWQLERRPRALTTIHYHIPSAGPGRMKGLLNQCALGCLTHSHTHTEESKLAVLAYVQTNLQKSYFQANCVFFKETRHQCVCVCVCVLWARVNFLIQSGIPFQWCNSLYPLFRGENVLLPNHSLYLTHTHTHTHTLTHTHTHKLLSFFVVTIYFSFNTHTHTHTHTTKYLPEHLICMETRTQAHNYQSGSAQ